MLNLFAFWCDAHSRRSVRSFSLLCHFACIYACWHVRRSFAFRFLSLSLCSALSPTCFYSLPTHHVITTPLRLIYYPPQPPIHPLHAPQVREYVMKPVVFWRPDVQFKDIVPYVPCPNNSQHITKPKGYCLNDDTVNRDGSKRVQARYDWYHQWYRSFGFPVFLTFCCALCQHAVPVCIRYWRLELVSTSCIQVLHQE